MPFGKVVGGVEVADTLNAEYGESIGGGIRGGNHGPLFESGTDDLTRNVPRLDFIRRATITEEAGMIRTSPRTNLAKGKP